MESKTTSNGPDCRPAVLQLTPYPNWVVVELRRYFDVLDYTVPDAMPGLLSLQTPQIVGIATSSRGQVSAELLDRLPNLRIIACSSAGVERIDLKQAAKRGIPVTSAGPVLANDVADVAMALLLCVGRRLVEADAFVRRGEWPNGDFPEARSLTGRRLAIVGLGNIGRAVARRAEAFGLEIGYTGRSRKPEANYPFFDDCRQAAAWCDFLLLSCPGGVETRHLVDRDVLSALGKDGCLINVARGSVVDQEALVSAIESGSIAGAGLDVFATEPDVPEALRRSERVVLLPHIGSSAMECSRRQAQAMIDALRRHLLQDRADVR